MGELDGSMFGNADIEAMMGLFGPTEEQRKRAERDRWLAAAFGLFSNPYRGQEGQAIGNAGMGALSAYNQTLDSASKQRLGALQGAMTMEKYNAGKRKEAQADEDRRAAAAILAGDAPVSGDSAGGAPAPTTLVGAIADRYRRLGDLYTTQGNHEAAKIAYAEAEKRRPKYSATPQVVRGKDGSIQLAQFSEHDAPRVVEGMTPAEKLHFGGTGGQTNVGFDPYSGAPVSAGMPATMDPAQKATRDLEERKFAYQKGKDAADNTKPQIVTGPNGEVYAVNAKTGTGAPVLGPDGQPLNKGEKPLTESQAKATAYANQMANASRNIADLGANGFTGEGRWQQGRLAAAGAEGIPYVMGSAAIPRMLSGADAQRYSQAELQWTEAALRFMTGANAPKEEVIRNADTYFPRPGDSPEKLAQKAEARANMEASVRMAAGGGNKQLPAMPDKKPLQKNLTALVKAREAIKAGKDPAAVRARMREQGFSDEGL